MEIKTLTIGQTVFCAARDGGPWYVRECVVGNEAWMGDGPNVLWPVCNGQADRQMNWRGPSADIFLTHHEAQAVCDKRQAEHVKNRERQNHDQEAKRATAKHMETLADKLYGEAMALAADVDDMDVVEHYCQGNVKRLREFIASRKSQQA